MNAKTIKKIKETVFRFHADPGHGWLAVKRTLLEELEILHKVSAFSYQRGKTVYLEEDCDYSLFYEALSSKGLLSHYGTIMSKESYTNNSSPVRSYEQFDSGPQFATVEGIHTDSCGALFGGKCSCDVENRTTV